MKKRLYLNFLCCSIIFLTLHHSFAQTRFFLTGSLGGGFPTTSFGGDALKKSKAFHGNGSLGLQVRKNDFISLEVGLMQQYQTLTIEDKSFASHYAGFEATMRNQNFFLSYFAALDLSLPIRSGHSYIYSRLSYSQNLVGPNSLSENRSYLLDGNDLEMTASVDYAESNGYFIPEIGYKQYLKNGNMFSFGLNFNMGNQNFMQGSYELKENEQILTSEEFGSKGSFVGLSIKYHMNLFYLPKRERQPKVKKKKEPKEEIVVADTTSSNNDNTVEGREMDVTHKIKVHSRKVKVKVWDHQMVDGDRISLNLNGKWVLEDYTLEKNQYVFEIELQEGTNLLILHALNLGKYHPNTAAIIVEDDKKEHQVILESDLQTSGTLEIKFKSHDK